MSHHREDLLDTPDDQELAERSNGGVPVAPGKPRILLHCPDITLKGKNQGNFQRALSRNIRQRLRHAGFDWHVGASRGRVCVTVPAQHIREIGHAVGILQEIPGIASLAATRWLAPAEALAGQGELNWALMKQAVVELARKYYTDNASFAIHINRADKQFPTTSPEMGRCLGEAIRQQTSWDRVDLKRPDQTFYIDIYPDGLYLYAEKIKGVGGLPVGTGGRVLGLLSGGIDSPVAAFKMTKRGCQVDLFHLSASHVQDIDPETSVIARLACRLSRYALRCRLYMAPYTYFDLALSGRQSGYELVLFRRFLMRSAEVLAGRIRARALVNGDSLGQVASQTLENLVSASLSIDMPVLRPLIGTNKDEIIAEARCIGTYDISIEPYKDCCALIARNPKTRSSHEQMNELEHALLPDYAEVIRKTLNDMICLEFKCGEWVPDLSD
ncbi:MAG: tRNA uracil 4-sulfurtransferase ThiI [Gammaproteobacteria bacterium]